MSAAARQGAFVYPRVVVGLPEMFVAVATVIPVLQVLWLVASATVPGEWLAWVFVVSGTTSVFGSLGLAIWRRSLFWLAVLLAPLGCWSVAFMYAYGAGIARMH